MKLFRYIVSIILLLLSFAGTAQSVQNDVSPSDSVIIFKVTIENKDGYWISGYIKSNGEVIAKPQFYKASIFINGMARVRFLDDDNSTTYIDTNGKVLKKKFDWFSEHFTPDGLCIVRDYKTEKCGFINKKGEYVIKPKFDEVDEFSEGLARVKVDGKYGYIDYNGKMVVEPSFVLAKRYFYNGLAGVYIDTVEWQQWKDGKHLCYARKVGFIDKTGRYVIKPQYDNAGNFLHGLAWIEIGGKYGFIDKAGNMVVEPQFDWRPEYEYKNGFYIVSKNSKYYGLVDTTGKIIFEPQSFVEPIFYEGYAQISTDEKLNGFGYLRPSNYG